MSKFDVIYQRAKANPQRIVLPEGNDERVLRAVAVILEKGYAKLTILADEKQLASDAKRLAIDLSKAEIINPKNHPQIDAYINEYYELRKAKGATLDEAKKLITENTVMFAGMMIRHGLADGFVAGAKFTTKDVARAAIQCIGIDRKVGIMSSAFIMLFPDEAFGEQGIFIFADCGIIPDPDAKQLAKISVSCGRLMQQLFDFKPKIAMLSYSTLGSGQGPMVDKVVEATKLAKQEAPDLLIDGELQGDSAIVKDVALKKCPNSPVAGNANILIFPDLNAGNIGYKLSQRFGRAKALGPLIIGANKPCSDLSRGCTMEEIIDIVAITSVRARSAKC
jgi:phosphate acetyltransferase